MADRRGGACGGRPPRPPWCRSSGGAGGFELVERRALVGGRRLDVLLANEEITAVALHELLDHARVAAVHVGVDGRLRQIGPHLVEAVVGGREISLGLRQRSPRALHLDLGAVVLLVQLTDPLTLGVQLCLDARRLSLLVLNWTSSSGCRAEKGKKERDPDEHAE